MNTIQYLEPSLGNSSQTNRAAQHVSRVHFLELPAVRFAIENPRLLLLSPLLDPACTLLHIVTSCITGDMWWVAGRWVVEEEEEEGVFVDEGVGEATGEVEVGLGDCAAGAGERRGRGPVVSGGRGERRDRTGVGLRSERYRFVSSLIIQ